MHLEHAVDLGTITAYSDTSRIAEGIRVAMLEITSEAISERFWDRVLVPKVGSNLRTGHGEGIPALTPAADEKTLSLVRVQL
jgi:hypothetical protein